MTLDTFEYRVGPDRANATRLWIGPMLEPPNTIGVIARSGTNMVELTIPYERIPDLIDVLGRALDTQEPQP